MVESFTPATLEEALEIRAANKVTLYAGGTDVMISSRHDFPFMFIGRLSELRRIYEDDEFVHIGPCVTYTEALASPVTPRLVKNAIAKIAAPAIRNCGTFGGNLGNGSGKADSVLADFVLDAQLVIASKDGNRIVPVDKFYWGRKMIDLADNEIIVDIMFPKKSIFDNCYFEKISVRGSLAISNISFAASWSTEGDVITGIALGIGAAGDTVLRVRGLEEMIVSRTLTDVVGDKEAIVDKYLEKMDFPLDRTSIEYRKQVCSMLIDFLIDFMD